MNFPAKLKCEAVAAEHLLTPYPEPKMAEAPWTPINTDARRDVEADNAKRKKFVVKNHYPPATHLVLAQLRVIVAGEVGGGAG